jgi:anti-anti-sigma regulatory factor
MLKITIQRKVGGTSLALEGKLAGPWVKELELCWRSAAGAKQMYPVRVDLSSVTFIDEDGKSLLKKMCQEGAELVAVGCLNRCIVEGITQSAKREI